VSGLSNAASGVEKRQIRCHLHHAGKPTFLVPATGLAVTTIVLKSRRTMLNLQIADGEFAVSSLWRKRPEGWRVIYSQESTTR
jgi:hypothetical protein